VGSLLSGDAEDREEYNINGSIRSKQDHDVNMFLFQLEIMIKYTPSMKRTIRAVLENDAVEGRYDLNFSNQTG
jgi:hypothetical protein